MPITRAAILQFAAWFAVNAHALGADAPAGSAALVVESVEADEREPSRAWVDLRYANGERPYVYTGRAGDQAELGVERREGGGWVHVAPAQLVDTLGIGPRLLAAGGTVRGCEPVDRGIGPVRFVLRLQPLDDHAQPVEVRSDAIDLSRVPARKDDARTGMVYAVSIDGVPLDVLREGLPAFAPRSRSGAVDVQGDAAALAKLLRDDGYPKATATATSDGGFVTYHLDAGDPLEIDTVTGGQKWMQALVGRRYSLHVRRLLGPDAHATIDQSLNSVHIVIGDAEGKK